MFPARERCWLRECKAEAAEEEEEEASLTHQLRASDPLAREEGARPALEPWFCSQLRAKRRAWPWPGA